MKKINNSDDNKDELDDFRKKIKTDVTDQMVPIPQNDTLHNEKEKCEKIRNEDVKSDEISLPDQLCKIESQDLSKAVNESEDVESSNSYMGGVPESFGVENNIENYDEDDTRCYEVEDAAANYEIEETRSTYDFREAPENYDPTDPPDSYESGDSVLPPSDAVFDNKGMSPSTDTTSTVYASGSVEDELEEVDADEQENEVEQEIEGRGYCFPRGESENDIVESNVSFTVIQGEREIVPEVEDVTCDSGGDTVLVMKNDVCSNECKVSKPNLSAEEDMTYSGQLNSIESVGEVIFHTRNTVIDSRSTSSSLHIGDDSVMKCRDNHLICELPERGNEDAVRYSGGYGEMGIGSVFPRRICNTAHVTSVPECSDSELYVYDSSVQNMVFCTNNAVIDASTRSRNSDVNSFETYSFHRVPIESSSGIKNMNDRYDHANIEMHPIPPDQCFGIDNRDIRTVKSVSSDEDFMRRIEKTLFESKIENRMDDTVDLKYKSDLDFSLPLKKRIKTLAALSNITCATEKFVSPKEDSFPSYPAKPMISIAELEFTEGLLPKSGITYQDNYK